VKHDKSLEEKYRRPKAAVTHASILLYIRARNGCLQNTNMSLFFQKFTLSPEAPPVAQLVERVTVVRL
jgi:hypothetical protein